MVFLADRLICIRENLFAIGALEMLSLLNSMRQHQFLPTIRTEHLLGPVFKLGIATRTKDMLSLTDLARRFKILTAIWTLNIHLNSFIFRYRMNCLESP